MRRVVYIGVVLALVLAACGGDGGGDDTPETTAGSPGTTQAPEAPATTAPEPTTTVAETTTTAAPAADAAVWVTNGADQKVFKIDPGTGETLLEVDVDSPPGGVALGAGSAWVASFQADYLLRLDAGTGEEQARIPIGTEGTGVTFSDGVAWVAQFGPGTVTAIDPATNEILKVVTVGAGATGMSPGSVWVTSWTDKKLSRVEVDFAADTAAVNAVVLLAEGSSPAAGDGYVGATLFTSGEFMVFDADDLLPIGTFDTGVNANVATYGFGAFWVTNSSTGDVYRIVPTEDEAQLVTTIPGATGITVGEDMVYVASFSNGVVYQFPPDNPSAMNDLAQTGSEAFEVAYGTGD